MAIFHFNTVVFSRAAGHSAVRGAAYRAGVALEDERAGKLEDYSRKKGVEYAEIIAPENAPSWVQDRAALWNAVERAEDRSTRREQAQLAYSITLALPHELRPEERHELVRGFVRERFVSLGMVADVAFHDPHEAGDDRNHHAHIMLTMRHLEAEGFGNKARNWQAQFSRFCNGRIVETHQLVALREAWADHANAALERAGHMARIDHRSLEAQGIEREATEHMGQSATAQERQGIKTDRGDRNRAIAERNAELETGVADLAEERERRSQAEQAKAMAAGKTATAAAYKEARQEAGRLWSALWQEVGGTEAKTDSEKAQARRRAFQHPDYAAYAEARDRRNQTVLVIAGERAGFAPHLKALHIREAALEADIKVARGADRESAERERQAREEAAELARLERKQARIERTMEATAERLRDRLTVEKDADPYEKAADVLNAITTYAATFNETELAGLIREVARDSREARAITAAIDRSGDVLPLYDPETGKAAERYTTRSQRTREEAILQNADRMAGRVLHRATDRGIRDAIAVHTLTPEQEAALRRATGCEGLTLIDGKAGTGKSYTLGVIRTAYERSGNAVIGLSPTHRAAAGLRDVGYGDATTAHSFLGRIEKGRVHYPQGTVLVLDEAGMVDTRTLEKLVRHATERSWKLILAGDAKQLASIEAGGLFGVLQARHDAATLKEVMRQKQAEHNAAAVHFARYEFAEGLALLDKAGAIQAQDSMAEAKAALLKDWTAAHRARPEASRFVFCYTNADVNEVNAAIRAGRVERGEIAAGIEVTAKHGRAAFAAGDRIQFLETSRALGLVNGTAGTVLAIDSQTMRVRLDGDKPQEISFPHGAFSGFGHGYAGTIYKGQGATLDETFLLHSHHWRDASSYVALTRHRHDLRVYTAREVAPDLPTLARQMARSDTRPPSIAFDTLEEARQRAQERERRRGNPSPRQICRDA